MIYGIRMLFHFFLPFTISREAKIIKDFIIFVVFRSITKTQTDFRGFAAYIYTIGEQLKRCALKNNA